MTGMGIVILVVCSIGIYSVLRWVFTQATSLSSKYLVKQPSHHPKKQKFIRIGHERKLVCYDDLPEANKYKGRTWLGGLPVYADIVNPDEHNYSTIIYMDHWFKQYVHDVMLTSTSSIPLLLFPLILLPISPVPVLIITGLVLVYLHLWWFPSSVRAIRRMGENAKNFTPDTWREIYQDVAESKAREDELVRALRRSGVRRL